MKAQKDSCALSVVNHTKSKSGEAMKGKETRSEKFESRLEWIEEVKQVLDQCNFLIFSWKNETHLQFAAL